MNEVASRRREKPVGLFSKLGLPVLIVAGAVLVAVGLVKSAPEAEKVETPKPVIEVEVLRAHPGDHPVTVQAMGEVRASQQLVLQPEVGGRVIRRNASIVPGAVIAAGEDLFKIDARDIQTSIAAQKAALEQARVQLADERGRKEVAEKEWGNQADALAESAREYALRNPHVTSAQASVSSAKSNLRRAKRDLGRTVIRSPFDAMVLDSPVEVGQLVSAQTGLVTLVSTDRYWVQISVPVSNLPFLSIPGINSSRLRGSAANVVYEAGFGVTSERAGYIERLEGQVDSRGRMARMLVAIEDPLSLEKPVDERPLPLLLGSFVKVALTGMTVENTQPVPREALFGGDRVWLVVDGQLAQRKVDIVFRDRTTVLVRGLAEGDAIVTTPLAAPTEGLEVSISGERSAPGEVGKEFGGTALEKSKPEGEDGEQGDKGDAKDNAKADKKG